MFNCDLLFQNPEESPAFIVAEIGINHDGDVSAARSAVAAAAEAGADGVKFQIYSVNGFYAQTKAQEAYNLFQRLSLSLDDFLSLRSYAARKGLLCFAAPFSEDILGSFLQQKIYPIKIASGDALTEPWLDRLLEADAPFMVSCGSLTEAETTGLGAKIQGAKAGLLYCVSQYPAPPEAFDLKYIDTLQKMLPCQPVGFSDHSIGLPLSLAAAARGAKIIERHFTLSPLRSDLDHPLSLGPEEFSSLVQGVRSIEKALGSGGRINSPEEQRIRPLAARSVYAAAPLKKGQIIQKQDLALLRPGSGVPSSFLKNLIGSPALQDYDQGECLSPQEEK